jgi:hypothetical protein
VAKAGHLAEVEECSRILPQFFRHYPVAEKPIAEIANLAIYLTPPTTSRSV